MSRKTWWRKVGSVLAFILPGGGMAATSVAPKSDPMNSMMVIFPYKYEGVWVFDDPKSGLVQEPFVAGIDTMIDFLVADIPDAEKGFKALFSATAFPGHTVRLEWRREEAGGNWYYSDRFKMEGWLCPALFKYFATAPDKIYVRADAKASG